MAGCLSSEILARLRGDKHLLDESRPLPPALVAKLREQMIIEWTYNSNSIEGNRLTLRETRLVLEEGVTIGGKSLREHLEAVNHREAIFFLEKLTEKSGIRGKDILKLHAIISMGIEEEFAGKYRTGQVRILGAVKLPPNYLKVPDLMVDLTRWINKNPERLNVVELAALAHYKLVAIHPFFDGNGRTARLLMNLILMQQGYPPAVVLRTDRKRYYNALYRADMGDPRPFVLLMAQSVSRSLEIYLEAAGKMTGKVEALTELARGGPYSADYLALMARRGRLRAVKIGRAWFSTHEAIEEYRAGRKRNR